MAIAKSTEKLIDKIRKLLALSTSSNEHEAIAAATRAAELMQEHQIVEAQLRIEDGSVGPEPIIESEVEQRTRMNEWRVTLADACARSVGAYTFTRRKVNVGTTLRLYGRESAVQTATYQFQYLTRQIEWLANAAYNDLADSCTRENSRGWKASFCHGATDRIRARLQESRQAFEYQARGAATGTALAVVQADQKATDDAWEQLSHKFRDRRCAYGPSSSSGYEAGQIKGASIPLGQGGKGISAPAKRIGT